MSCATSTAVCKNGGFSDFLETFMLVESSGISSNFGAEKPPLLQAAKRYGQGYDDTTRQTKSGSF